MRLIFPNPDWREFYFWVQPSNNINLSWISDAQPHKKKNQDSKSLSNQKLYYYSRAQKKRELWCSSSTWPGQIMVPQMNQTTRSFQRFLTSWWNIINAVFQTMMRTRSLCIAAQVLAGQGPSLPSTTSKSRLKLSIETRNKSLEVANTTRYQVM